MYKFKLKLIKDSVEGQFHDVVDGITEEEVNKMQEEIGDAMMEMMERTLDKGYVTMHDMVETLHGLYPPGSKQWEYLVLFSLTDFIAGALDDIQETISNQIMGNGFLGKRGEA